MYFGIKMTLYHFQLRAKTTVMTSFEFTEDLMWLNGEYVLLNSEIKLAAI